MWQTCDQVSVLYLHTENTTIDSDSEAEGGVTTIMSHLTDWVAIDSISHMVSFKKLFEDTFVVIHVAEVLFSFFPKSLIFSLLQTPKLAITSLKVKFIVALALKI